MNPLVSILIPCFNAEHLVGQAIESALAQTWSRKEIIVIDDGSTDRSLDVIRRFNGRIRWETGPNRGGNAARNRLLELSNGQWLQYLDADDYLRAGKVQAQVEFLRENQACDVVYSAVAGEILVDGRPTLQQHPIPEPRDPWILLAHWDLPQTGSPLWRKATLQSVGGWRIGQPCCQEHELYFRLLEMGACFTYCDCCHPAVYRRWNHGVRISDVMPLEVHRQRMLILDRVEIHLRTIGQLWPARHAAINDTRHATARAIWNHDRGWARSIVERIYLSDSNYVPWNQPASPLMYSVTYRLFGFEATQMVASYKRLLSSPLTRSNG